MTYSIDLSDCLAHNDSQARLEEIHTTDYYWYLRSKEFVNKFLFPIAYWASDRGNNLLDVGCGEGIIGDLYEGMDHALEYVGIEGSIEAVRKANERNSTLDIRQGRIEKPTETINPKERFDVIVFGGILEVIVKDGRRLEFVETYIDLYGASYIIVYDLMRLDLTQFNSRYVRVEYLEDITATEVEPEVKRHRKCAMYYVGHDREGNE